MKGLLQIPGPFTGLDQYSYLPLVRPPALSTWTQASATNGTLTDDPKWGIGLIQAKNPAQPLALMRAVSVPYTVICAFLPFLTTTANSGFMVWVSDGTKYEGFNVIFSTAGYAPKISKWTNIATYLSDLVGVARKLPLSPLWFAIAEDVTHRTFSVSPDGQLWETIYQENTATYLTTSSIGVGLSADVTYQNSLRLLSWSGA